MLGPPKKRQPYRTWKKTSSLMTREKIAFNNEQARQIGDTLGIDWDQYEIDEFQMGLEVELEHGVRDPNKQITHDDLLGAGKIAWAHLNDNADYYIRFERIG
jgi:hypothetical protein